VPERPLDAGVRAIPRTCDSQCTRKFTSVLNDAKRTRTPARRGREGPSPAHAIHNAPQIHLSPQRREACPTPARCGREGPSPRTCDAPAKL